MGYGGLAACAYSVWRLLVFRTTPRRIERMNIRSYSRSDRYACLEILESNTPEFFIPTDCNGYGAFLDNLPGPYFVFEESGQIAACGGWAMDSDDVADLTWGWFGAIFIVAGWAASFFVFGSTRSRTIARLHGCAFGLLRSFRDSSLGKASV